MAVSAFELNATVSIVAEARKLSRRNADESRIRRGVEQRALARAAAEQQQLSGFFDVRGPTGSN